MPLPSVYIGFMRTMNIYFSQNIIIVFTNLYVQNFSNKYWQAYREFWWRQIENFTSESIIHIISDKRVAARGEKKINVFNKNIAGDPSEMAAVLHYSRPKFRPRIVHIIYMGGSRPTCDSGGVSHVVCGNGPSGFLDALHRPTAI